MQRLSRVTDDGEALGDVFVRTSQRQRIQLPLPHPREAAEAETERVLQAREELGIAQGRHFFGGLGTEGPHHAQATFGQRQQRQRPRISETLVRDVIVEVL